jgi:hypothetical protein
VEHKEELMTRSKHLLPEKSIRQLEQEYLKAEELSARMTQKAVNASAKAYKLRTELFERRSRMAR